MTPAEAMGSTAAMRAVFAPGACVQAMLDVEVGLARAGAACWLVPAEALNRIIPACVWDGADLQRLEADGQLAGTIVVPLVAWLKQRAGADARYVHIGGTSQDVLDNALVLQLRAAVDLLLKELQVMAAAAAEQAAAHSATPMLARTLLQAALPTTFGLKAATWLAAIEDSRSAIERARAEAFMLQCGGAAGTLDVVAEQAEEFAAAFGAALALPVPILPWHTRRAPLLRLAAAIAGAVGVAGKIGTDIALMMQSEVAEALEPAAPGRGTSSAMAHKRNPTLSIMARAAATRMPGYLSMLASAQMQEHERAAGPWQAEAAIWPQLMNCAAGALAAMAEALPGLTLDAARMTENLRLIAPAAPGAAEAMVKRVLGQYKKEDAAT